MKEIKEEELKKIQLDILKYLDSFCRKNHINYMLDYGTLLGAVRHGGYIPWDDDIDISMLREDYDKLMKLSSKMDSRYKFYCYETDKDCCITYGKVLDTRTILYEPNKENGTKTSVFIDVFVYDNKPNDIEYAKKSYKQYIKYKRLNDLQMYSSFYNKKRIKYNFIRYPFHLFLQIFPKRYFVKRNIKIHKKYANIDTGYIAPSGHLCKKELAQDLIEMEFEGYKFLVPREYDLWLKLIFGDYMKLPPVEKRVSHHCFEAYYKEEDKND